MKNPPDIRLANETDIAPLLEISNWAALNTPANFAVEPELLSDWLESWRTTHVRYPWLVAVDGDDRVIGFAKASPHRGRCAYAYTAEVSVYVHPEHHGRGVGTALYAILIPMLKSQGFVTLVAGITSPNPASEKLHAAFGFRRVGMFERVGWKFGQWHDVGYLQLTLSIDAKPPDRIKTVAEVQP